MCWQCDHPDKTVDDYLDLLRTTIREHRWAVQYVEDDRVPYAYTVGLHARGLPELLLMGLAPHRSLQLLNHAAEHAILEGPPCVGAQFFLLDGQRVEVVEVDHPQAHMGMAVAIARAPITARQLVWADRLRRWPWGPDFDDGFRRQPVLGVRATQSGGPKA